MLLLLLPSSRCFPLYWGLDQVAQLAPPPYSCSVRIFISYLFSLTNHILPYPNTWLVIVNSCFFLKYFSKDPQNGLSMLLCKSFGGPSSQLWKPFVIWIFYSGKMVKDVKVCCVIFNFQAMVWWKTLPGQNEKLAKGQIDLKQFRQGEWVCWFL